MPSNPYQSKRVQVVFSQTTRDVMEAFGEDRGLTNSKAVACLVEEALRARGLLVGKETPKSKTQQEEDASLVAGYFPPMSDEETTKVIKTTGQEPFTVKPKTNTLSQELVETTTETLTRETSTSIREQKLRLMQDLIEQLKTL